MNKTTHFVYQVFGSNKWLDLYSEQYSDSKEVWDSVSENLKQLRERSPDVKYRVLIREVLTKEITAQL